jgi:transcriptional regulator GlxA family with amidase domain
VPTTLKATTPLRRPEPLRVGVILANNFTLSAFALFVDHLRLAADEGDRSRPVHVQWSTMSSRNEPVRASCGVSISPTSPLIDPAGLDYIAVVGGLLHAGPQIDQATTQYLRDAAAIGIPLIGLCTGSFILCRSGLMRGRRCCVSWYHYQDFVDEFPDHEVVADRLFISDRDRITCAGGAGTADLATFILELHLGRAVAQKANQVLLFDRARAGNDAQPHPPLFENVSDERVRRALLLMEQNLARPVAIGYVAKQLGLSVRQFERLCRSALGTGPASLYRRIRMRYAQWLINNTDRSMTTIALEAGFADGAHFSRQYKETFGLSPSLRRKQGLAAAEGDRACTRVFD